MADDREHQVNWAPFPQGPVGAAGIAVIRESLKTMPATPGVYRMVNERGDVLYVGKAKNLRKRVVNYAHVPQLPERLRRMVAETASMEIITTHTEIEALLLESNLIKRLAPRYNILLRDDKSFPYILITGDHAWPRIVKHRGARSLPGDYFGPFASAGAVNQTLAVLQRVFLLRSCSDAVFGSRTRPCLLHQIKRCCAPCVGRITPEDYTELVAEARRFLSGGSTRIKDDLSAKMQVASDEMNYEQAALFRDRIRALAQIQAHQDINLVGLGDADVVAAHQAGGQTCVQVFFFRGGCNYGNRAYFPAQARNLECAEVLAAFLGQFYDNKPPPALLLLSEAVPEQDLIAEALSVKAGAKVTIQVPQRGDKRKLVEHAHTNAREALGRRMAESASQRQLLEGVAACFGLETVPERIEVYDNSHISGTNAVGAMIVAGPEGLVKSAYRKFNIKGDLTPGDDYAMMREVLTRRFARALKEDSTEEWPDLVLIDGGAGQLTQAVKVFADLGVVDVAVAAISKGPERNAGREKFHLPDRPVFSLEARDPVLYFLQRLRDEAHRFAIGTHRAKRSKGLVQSLLDEVPGIGPSRKRALLHHFGSARAVADAGLADIQAVAGFSRTMAKKVYDHFHGEG